MGFMMHSAGLYSFVASSAFFLKELPYKAITIATGTFSHIR